MRSRSTSTACERRSRKARSASLPFAAWATASRRCGTEKAANAAAKDRRLKIFQREQRSLFGEILDWMLTPLLLLWPVSLALTWLVAQSIADKPFDRALEYNVQTLAQLVTVKRQRVVFNLPQPARELLRADDSDLVYYQVPVSYTHLRAHETD